MQTTAEANTASPATGTIAQPYLAMYIRLHDEQASASNTLFNLYRRRKPGEERDAIREGHYALKIQSEKTALDIRQRGGLLFVGCKAALQTAQEMERARRARELISPRQEALA